MCKIEDLIKSSLQELQKIGWENKYNEQESKLIFPKKGDETKRISEQEARFLFVRELEKLENKDFYYSIETPTLEKYSGFSKGIEPKINTEGRSGSIDVTLYEKDNDTFIRKHLIEFKQGNVDTCKKDFLKLLCDDKNCKTNYYINIINNCDSGTIRSLVEKYNVAIQYVFDRETILSELVIFVYVLGNIANTVKNIDSKNRTIIYKINKENKEMEQVKL